LPSSTALEAAPVEFVLAHKTKQKDAPYRKGAVLCVSWGFSTGPYNGSWDTYGCVLSATNDTHSSCKCQHMTDFAVLMEDYTPPGRLPEVAYYICYGLCVVSCLILIYFMFLVLGCDRLHYEIHIVHWHCALAMFLALVFYLLTIPARADRLACVASSVFLHYSYTAAYSWMAINAHYIFRASTSGELGGRILTIYSYIGWGIPAIFVMILCIVDISRYGVGDRCLGAHNDYFLWLYIGVFIALCFVIMPLVIIAFVNIGKQKIKDPIDNSDIRFGLVGLAIMWPFIMVVWLFAMFIYLIPIDLQLIDFLFELFNSLQGIVLFLTFGVMIPSFRTSIRTCGKAEGRDFKKKRAFMRKIYVQYYSEN